MAKSNDDDIQFSIPDIEPEEQSVPKKKKTAKDKTVKEKPSKEKSLIVQSRILGILFILMAVLLLTALLSYTSRDEINTHISFSDLFGMFGDDPDIRTKVDTTQNWLGLVGALISKFMISGTLGYVVIIIPIFILRWGVELIRKNEISHKLLRSTNYILLLAVLVSALFGTFQNMNVFAGMAHEWSGTIGLFLGTLFSKFIGPIGAFLIYTSLIIIVVTVGNHLRIKQIIKMIIPAAVKSYSYASSAAQSAKETILKFKEQEMDAEEESDSESDDANLDTTTGEANRAKTEDKVIIDNSNDTSKVNADRIQIEPIAKVPTVSNPVDTSNVIINKAGAVPAPVQARLEPTIVIRNAESAASVFATPAPVVSKIAIPKPEERAKIAAARSSKIGLRKIEDDVVVSVGSNVVKANEIIQTATPAVEAEETKADEVIKEEIPSVKAEVKPKAEAPAVQEKKTSEYNAEVMDFEPHSEQEDDDEIILPNISANKPAYSEPKIDVNPPAAKPIMMPTPVKVDVAASVAGIASTVAATAVTGAAVAGATVFPQAPKPLVVTVNEVFDEPDANEINSLLNTGIHDKELDYVGPGISLLNNQAEEVRVNEEELKNNARTLQEKLETFKINIEDLRVTPGPVVTQYEFVPAAGIKISRIESLSDDLAMALKARGIRIIAPVPGKGTVGVEIPNLKPAMVRFSHLVNTTKFVNAEEALPIALGKTISGEVFIADLAKMPHLLIAGATGSGKSVGMNTIIASLLYKKHPSELKFIMVDPKKVELQNYAKLKLHFMASSPDVEDTIVTNPPEAVAVLKSVVLEMENRYTILAKVGQRNIADYNQKVKAGLYDNIADFDHRPMPYIVVVIDELADLMLTAGKETEEPIIRLAQMARAVGIHLIIATQRPSVDVITGIIKANFPARIAYQVASKVDSRTILDTGGAEQLLGNGDMLFLPSGAKPLRIQNAFISTDEVENICMHIGKQEGYDTPYMLPSVNDNKAIPGMMSAADRDPLFEDAAKIVIMQQQASVSLLQRRLKVGYARAGRIVDELEDAGIIGPNEGSKARLVLLDSESQLERIL